MWEPATPSGTSELTEADGTVRGDPSPPSSIWPDPTMANQSQNPLAPPPAGNPTVSTQVSAPKSGSPVSTTRPVTPPKTVLNPPPVAPLLPADPAVRAVAQRWADGTQLAPGGSTFKIITEDDGTVWLLRDGVASEIDANGLVNREELGLPQGPDIDTRGADLDAKLGKLDAQDIESGRLAQRSELDNQLRANLAPSGRPATVTIEGVGELEVQTSSDGVGTDHRLKDEVYWPDNPTGNQYPTVQEIINQVLEDQYPTPAVDEK